MPVIPIIARSGRGLDDLKNAVARELTHPALSHRAFAWLPSEHKLAQKIRELAPSHAPEQLDAETITSMATLRYAWIRTIVGRAVHTPSQALPRTTKLDAILTSKVWGLPILLVVFGLIFQAIVLWAQLPMELISTTVDEVSGWVGDTLPAGLLTSLLAEGIIPGVGNVIVFVPPDTSLEQRFCSITSCAEWDYRDERLYRFFPPSRARCREYSPHAPFPRASTVSPRL